MTFLKQFVAFLLVTFLVYEAKGCRLDQFTCSNMRCIHRRDFCDNRNDCGDGSDERYCDLSESYEAVYEMDYNTYNGCPGTWISCSNRRRCIPGKWKCDGHSDCPDGSDEVNCISGRSASLDDDIKSISGVAPAKSKLVQWLQNLRKTATSTDKWGPQLHRIAVALHLAEDSTLVAPGNSKHDEIGYELTIQLLKQLYKNKKLRTQELALYVNAMLVSCVDPRDFYGDDLVKELRNRVDSSNYTNPFEILVLCNAGDTMTSSDANRVTAVAKSQHIPFWTETQAIATMALTCLSSRSTAAVDKKIHEGMINDLKRRQFRNGTVDNLKSTALVVQALLTNQTYKVDFDLESAIKSLLESQKTDGSFGSLLNSYYILPVLNYKSLLNVNNSHCSKRLETEEDALKKMLEGNGERFTVQYSVFVGNQAELVRTWKIKLNANLSFYDAIETVRRLDNRHNVEYNVIAGKPYVSALTGLENDAEMELYWFTYARSLNSKEKPSLIEKSPVDVLVQDNQEFILWYKPGIWIGDTLKPEIEKADI